MKEKFKSDEMEASMKFIDKDSTNEIATPPETKEDEEEEKSEDLRAINVSSTSKESVLEKVQYIVESILSIIVKGHFFHEFQAVRAKAPMARIAIVASHKSSALDAYNNLLQNKVPTFGYNLIIPHVQKYILGFVSKVHINILHFNFTDIIPTRDNGKKCC